MGTIDHEQRAEIHCFHCGEHCIYSDILFDDKHFCCTGCKTVYEILDQNQMCTYYQIESHPGKKQLHATQIKRFEVLNDVDLQTHFILFQNATQVHVQFDLPNMHCNSCIWLLEQLHRFEPAVYKSTVNFIKKQIKIVYDPQQLALSDLAILLAKIGYEPHLSLEQLESDIPKNNLKRAELYRIGIAGFCFANIMMFSFPEYFGIAHTNDMALQRLFSYVILCLSLPAFFYSGMVFFVSGWKGLKHKHLNIDLPIALAIGVTFVRSVFEICSGTGAGFMDSMSGIIFFMLVGRYFQEKTYHQMSFERNYKSYFPISTTCMVDEKEQQIPISKIQIGDVLFIRNQELIPADAVLLDKEAFLDYSFITGESQNVHLLQGQLIYAGVRLLGAAVRVQVVKPTEQSYLTSLWNQSKPEKTQCEPNFIHRIATVFGLAIIVISVFTLVFWLWRGSTTVALNAMTAVLIVACPCALLLTSTFTFGHVLNILSRNQIFLKNAAVVDKMSNSDAIVFDKTGTMTLHQEAEVEMKGERLKEYIWYCAALSKYSTHPLSQKIASLSHSNSNVSITHFRELPNLGIEAQVNEYRIRMGNDLYIFGHSKPEKATQSLVHVEVDGTYVGTFYFFNKYRNGIARLMQQLKTKVKLYVLTGDHNAEMQNLKHLLGEDAELFFEQSPADKRDFVTSLQTKGHKVMMVGDGLNDAIAMENAYVGVAVSDEFSQFNPACDVIIKGSQLPYLYQFVRFCKSSKYVILFSFLISIVYNLVGLFFAVQGDLLPIVAAILMPLSSITIVFFTTVGTVFSAKFLGLK